MKKIVLGEDYTLYFDIPNFGWVISTAGNPVFESDCDDKEIAMVEEIIATDGKFVNYPFCHGIEPCTEEDEEYINEII